MAPQLSPQPTANRNHREKQDIAMLHRLASAFAISAEGFDSVAADFWNWQSPADFARLSIERQRATSELRSIARRSGPPPQAAKMWLAGHLRNWLAVRAALSSGNGDSVKREVRRAERFFLERCEAAHERMPATANREVVRRHTGSIRRLLKAIGEG
ncbi:hypothetical protein Pla108_15970 [Botrimarina colliarenosi]|uniref:DUF2383 domain-containing protein n=1 Tax=Botrimarina colliarenosi TaxID=2528001 RepID=A0A5C6AKU0_9BACT|nr:DUF2383 domain-containing protein [Botrimarina colliarenosi]TWU00645.1 hypothetical protein Pla108_15970 [Botrimarina colliarenosi]